MLISSLPTSILTEVERNRWSSEGFKSLQTVLEGVNIVGVGESAHFTREFNEIRAALIQFLAEEYGFTTIALECSTLQAERLNDWLTEDNHALLKDYAGPLTCALYGTVLNGLKSYLNGNMNRSGIQISLAGVDLPNTLSPVSEMEQMALSVRELDPSFETEMVELVELLKPVKGESAVMSSAAWSKLGGVRQDRAFSIMTRLKLRLNALKPVICNVYNEANLERALAQINCIEYTLESLRAISNLFEGSALDGETSVRDLSIAQSLLELTESDPEERTIFLAHNNHIQKTPVSFAGELSGVPAGQHIAGRLGKRYRAIAITHFGDTIPEMDFPSSISPVGFDVKLMPAEELQPESIEEQLRQATQGDTVLAIVGNQLVGAKSLSYKHIRSQAASAVTDIGKAFDVVCCTSGANKDTSVSF